MTTQEQYHFIGIGGIGMSGLAHLLMKRGIKTSGSDVAVSYITEGLVSSGAQVHIGHAAQQIPVGATVIYTTGIDETNPELYQAKQLGNTLMHRSDLLAQMTQGYETIAVAGMHGKTTTSALLAAVLAEAKLDPSFAIGGIVTSFKTNARHGEGPYFVIEACESDGTYLKYRPTGAIITNIDLEHMDYFKTEESLIESFSQFINSVVKPEFIFWCGDDQRLRWIAPPGISYGFNEDCDLHITFQEQKGWQQSIDIEFYDKKYTNITVSLLGNHNALNAAAVFGYALSLGIEESDIRRAFKDFKGIKRRCDIKGEVRGITVIDDYAHHPVELKTTLEGLREAVGERRIIAIYQPHRYTRSRDCLGLFSDVFTSVDQLIVTDIYSAEEDPIPGVDNEAVYQDIVSNNQTQISFIPKDSLLKAVSERLRPHDVVVTLGAGNITSFGNELIQHLQTNPIAKLKVALVFGGRSSEHEISLLSARNISSVLSQELYDVEYFAITPSGHWISSDAAKHYLETGKLQQQPFGNPISAEVLNVLSKCETLFPVLHGPYGEDGTIQGLCEMLEIAYVGCNFRACAVSMDKAMTKAVMSAYDIPTLEFISFNRKEWRQNTQAFIDEIEEQLKFPVFVKPVHLGSTIGVSKVTQIDQLKAAVEAAFTVDTEVLIEPGVIARELEFALLGSEAFPPGEILTSGRIYDYTSKYKSDELIPVIPKAVLPPEISEEGRALAREAFRAVGGTGMARIDFFYDDKGNWWLNEINPIPGFTKNSLYPLMCEANGIPQNELVDRLIILSLSRQKC